MPRARVHRGLTFNIGPIRILVTDVRNETASVHVIFNNETTLGAGQACPVESIERLLNWYEKLQIAMVNDGIDLATVVSE